MLVVMVLFNIYYMTGLALSLYLFMMSGGPPDKDEIAGFIMMSLLWPKYIYRYIRGRNGK
jgi:hypothetical protein